MSRKAAALSIPFMLVMLTGPTIAGPEPPFGLPLGFDFSRCVLFCGAIALECHDQTRLACQGETDSCLHDEIGVCVLAARACREECALVRDPGTAPPREAGAARRIAPGLRR